MGPGSRTRAVAPGCAAGHRPRAASLLLGLRVEEGSLSPDTRLVSTIRSSMPMLARLVSVLVKQHLDVDRSGQQGDEGYPQVGPATAHGRRGGLIRMVGVGTKWPPARPLASLLA